MNSSEDIKKNAYLQIAYSMIDTNKMLKNIFKEIADESKVDNTCIAQSSSSFEMYNNIFLTNTSFFFKFS